MSYNVHGKLNNRYFAIISSSAQPDNTVFETMTFSKPSTNEYRNDFHLANLVSKHSIKASLVVVSNNFFEERIAP